MPHDSRLTKRRRLALVGAALLATAGMGILAVIASQRTPVAETSPNETADPKASSSDRRLGGDVAKMPPATGRLVADTGIGHPSTMEYRLRDSVDYLASDELEGRGLGTRGIELAASYIAEQFERAGLRTDHYQGSPFQRFHRTQTKALTGRNTLHVQGPDGTAKSLSLRREYTPLSFTTSAKFDLAVAFAGYGITAAEAGYDDYANLDVQGKAVILLRHEPQQGDRESPFHGTQITDHAYLHRKVSNAVAHGAAAVLFCTDEYTLGSRAAAYDGGQAERLTEDARQRLDTLLGFRVRGTIPERRILVVHVQRHAVEDMIFRSTGDDLGGLERRIDETLQPQSCLLEDCRVEGQITVGEITKDLKNVVASLDGEGPLCEETIVVGAHYDHVGLGGWGSLSRASQAVHNGADDNASGTAVVMELGRQLAGREASLARRVVFVAFTAEESGLVGSEYYAARPLVPLEQTVAMFNFDMVGYLRTSRLQVYGTGTAREFDSLLYKWGTVHGLQLQTQAYGYGMSDHASFHAHGVPVLHFFTGFHDHYHRPSDDWDKLNIRGMRRITELARDLVIELANRGQRPRPLTSWEDSLYAELSPLHGRHVKAERVNWGIEVRRVDGQAGLVIERIAKWGLADRFGFRHGDRILAIGSHPLSVPDDYERAVADLGDAKEVSVIFERGGLELEVQVAVN